MSYIDEATVQVKRLTGVIANDPDFTANTKKTISEYINFMQAKGLNDRTINKNLYCLANFIKIIKGKDILDLSKDEVTSAMAIVERSKYSNKTKQNIKISIKSLFKHFLGQDDFYPENVRWIKATLRESKRILPEDILSEEDILKMLDSATDVRDSALIALLFDSGIRIGELLNMRYKDVEINSEPAHITVDGKTGMRKIPIMFSVPYLGNYLNINKKKKPTDLLWTSRGTWSNLNHPIDRAGAAKILRVIAKKAQITKRVNPHSFRHARATNYANKLTEQQLKAFFGWTGGSKMASTYVHLSGRDIDNAVMQANGVKIPENTIEPRLKVQTCPKCRTPNGIDFSYCTRCGSPLDIVTVLNAQKTESSMKDAIAEALKDPKAIEEIVHSYLLLQAKKEGKF